MASLLKGWLLNVEVELMIYSSDALETKLETDGPER